MLQSFMKNSPVRLVFPSNFSPGWTYGRDSLTPRGGDPRDFEARPDYGLSLGSAGSKRAV